MKRTVFVVAVLLSNGGALAFAVRAAACISDTDCNRECGRRVCSWRVSPHPCVAAGGTDPDPGACRGDTQAEADATCACHGHGATCDRRSHHCSFTTSESPTLVASGPNASATAASATAESATAVSTTSVASPRVMTEVNRPWSGNAPPETLGATNHAPAPAGGGNGGPTATETPVGQSAGGGGSTAALGCALAVGSTSHREWGWDAMAACTVFARRRRRTGRKEDS